MLIVLCFSRSVRPIHHGGDGKAIIFIFQTFTVPSLRRHANLCVGRVAEFGHVKSCLDFRDRHSASECDCTQEDVQDGKSAAFT